MINELLLILKDAVNAHLSATSGWVDGQSDQGQVVFWESDRVEAVDFKLGAITLLVVNLEQEHSLRQGDPYRVSLPDGTTQRVAPPLFLSCVLMFSARFKDYLQAWRYLSSILQYFQSRRVLDHENTPALPARIEKVVMEFISPPLAELQNLWGLLKTAHQPSLLYRARLVIYQDEDGAQAAPISTATMRIKQ